MSGLKLPEGDQPQLYTRTNHRATKHHLPHGITQCYMSPDTAWENRCPRGVANGTVRYGIDKFL